MQPPEAEENVGQYTGELPPVITVQLPHEEFPVTGVGNSGWAVRNNDTAAVLSCRTIASLWAKMQPDLKVAAEEGVTLLKSPFPLQRSQDMSYMCII